MRFKIGDKIRITYDLDGYVQWIVTAQETNGYLVIEDINYSTLQYVLGDHAGRWGDIRAQVLDNDAELYTRQISKPKEFKLR